MLYSARAAATAESRALRAHTVDHEVVARPGVDWTTVVLVIIAAFAIGWFIA